MVMGSMGEDVVGEEFLVRKITEIYEHVSKLPSLKPSEDVNTLFTELVTTCIPPSSIDVAKLSKENQSMRSNLIKLCGTAEGFLERHYANLLSTFDHPLQHLDIFPYYSNYLKLSLLEHTILANHAPKVASAATRVAFIGSGPLPLTSIVLALHHMKSSVFHNYDVDPVANSMASRLTLTHQDLSQRMLFRTTDIMDVTTDLHDYDVVFLAALVGMDIADKLQVLNHLANHMAPGAMLMLRSAAGARAFLYPVVDPSDLQDSFEVLSVFHPTDEVINSVVIARKHSSPLQKNQHQQQSVENQMVLPCKRCSKIEAAGFNHGCIVEEQAS